MQFQQSHFATLLKSHPRKDALLKSFSTPADTLLQDAPEHHGKTASVYQKSFKRLELYKVIIYSC